jgi:ribosome modulation factor
MDYAFYHDCVSRMQRMNVREDYIQGWIGGYMGNPKREEQRVSDAYEAGYQDGENGDASKMGDWVDLEAESG